MNEPPLDGYPFTAHDHLKEGDELLVRVKVQRVASNGIFAHGKSVWRNGQYEFPPMWFPMKEIVAKIVPQE
jgi:hypothetical protein